MSNPTKSTMYTVTIVYSNGDELTSKQVFVSLQDAKDYIGRDVVADDGTINVKGTYRINTHGHTEAK